MSVTPMTPTSPSSVFLTIDERRVIDAIDYFGGTPVRLAVALGNICDDFLEREGLNLVCTGLRRRGLLHKEFKALAKGACWHWSVTDAGRKAL